VKGFVLAGGWSRRMGCDKARLPRDGEPLAAFVARILRLGGCDEVVILRGEDDGLPFVDRDGSSVPSRVEATDATPRHPLRGIALALRDLGDDAALFAPTDLYSLDASAVARLLAHPTGVVASAYGVRCPLLAVIPSARAAAAADLARAGAAAWRLTEDLPSIEIGDAAVDADTPDLRPPAPIRGLLRRLNLTDAAAARLVAGERVRQRARGVVDPDLDRAVFSPSLEVP
jgi:molybdopterin-guanine dinucleotide biosynthesis protein A